MNRKADFLVIGSGIAGLSYALKVAEYGSVIVLSKTDILETTTRYAQGGIAAAMSFPDTFEKHIADTLDCGCGLSDEKIVRMVAKEAPKIIKKLVKWGTEFDKNSDGGFELAREGGHSESRVLHHKDNTGSEIQRALTEKVMSHPNIIVLEHYFALDLITQHHLGKLVKRGNEDITCYGIYACDFKTMKTETILSKITLLATGGIGNLYSNTTNPKIVTGDGIALSYRAKGVMESMEFVQFHPTALYNPRERPSFLISEALRGFGAILKTIDGTEFMHKYDVRGSLAPRDITAKAIDNEMKTRGEEFVLLDCNHLDETQLKEKFPTIYQKCFSLGIRLGHDMIPVVPAAHYLCGGIKVDASGRSSIKNLYAAGEVASTGLHGANRLASNSLLEAVVFADTAARHARKVVGTINYIEGVADWDTSGTSHPEEMILITQNRVELQQLMSNYVGIVRSDIRLNRAMSRLEILYKETEELYKKSTLSQELCELRNLIIVGYLVIRMAQRRKESIGLHYTIDYP